MAGKLISRIFDWHRYFLETAGSAAVGPREVEEAIRPVVEAFGTGRLQRNEVIFQAATAAAATAVEGAEPIGNEVFFVPALDIRHNTPAATPDLSLVLRVQLGGIDRDIVVLRAAAVAQGVPVPLERPFVVPGRFRFALLSSAAVDLELRFFRFVLALGETAWWP